MEGGIRFLRVYLGAPSELPRFDTSKTKKGKRNTRAERQMKGTKEDRGTHTCIPFGLRKQRKEWARKEREKGRVNENERRQKVDKDEKE